MATIAVAPVLTLHGARAVLRDYWRRATTVTSFVRQFGCVFCHQAVDDLIAAVPELVRRNARVVIVGNGSVDQARRFYTEKNLPRDGIDVVTDPGRDTYRAAGFERGYARTFLHPASAAALLSARRQGHRVTGLFGDLTQLGGLMVVVPPAKLAYLYRSRYAGDHPDLSDVLDSLPSG